MKKIVSLVLLLLVLCSSKAQLKFIVEDFEGFSEGPNDLKPNGIFTFGNVKARAESKASLQLGYSGYKSLKLERDGKSNYGGWGKGVGVYMQLDVMTDHLNFYVYQPAANDTNTIKIELQEDDDQDGLYNKDNDDSWTYSHTLDNKNAWKLISVPLSKFTDSNKGGDGVFNVSYKDGKLICFIMTFAEQKTAEAKYKTWDFDFICFSKGKLSTGTAVFDPPSAAPSDHCNLGAWSKEGNTADFVDIATAFEEIFKPNSDKKLGVAHFFQPFSFDGGNALNLYPSVERINKVIKAGYVPMITLEDRFVNAKPGTVQPNLYSIVEGHLDEFFTDWAKQIKKVQGTVLLRILHEFNGDWYPWCIVNNDRNPELFIKAYHRIYNVFKNNQVNNVKFIWCPNSMSLPQEKWNFIMAAYPGDEYVDYLGIDVYNGAGKSVLWRSFRKEAIENYFYFTESLPARPILICETASRERNPGETKAGQDKAGWIQQMSEALKTDMSKVRLLAWFNEKESFRVNSSPESRNAFLNYILKDPYFRNGSKEMEVVRKK